MRTRGIEYLAAAMMIFVSISWAWAGGPVAVSPGSADGGALIRQNCPTFSWSSAEDVASYRLDVYEQITGDAVSHDQMQLLSQPVISKTIAVPALSWTPSEGECLERGRQYVWYVQGVHFDGEGQWSGSMGFRVEANELSSEYKTAINEAVKEYLASAAGKAVLSTATEGAGSSIAAITTSNGPLGRTGTQGDVAVNRAQAAAIAPNAVMPGGGLTIGSNGSVGIGLDNPAAKLDVSGNAIFSGASQQMLYIIGSDGGGTWMNLDNTSAGGRSWGLISSGSSNGEGAGKLLIRDHAANAVRATFDAGGNIGIGTDSPAAKLDVIGNIKAQNMPAIKSAQTFVDARGAGISLTGPTDIDNLTVTVPSDGFLMLSATFNVYLSAASIGFGVYAGTVFFRLSETTSGTNTLVEQVANLNNLNAITDSSGSTIIVNWVVPAVAGSRSFKTTAETTNGAVTYFSHTLTAMFFPNSM